MRTNRKLIIAILGVIMVLLGIGSWRLLDFSVRSIALYRSPYTFQVQPGLGSQPLAQRLILVTVDGFESGNFENMLTVRDIANRGIALYFQESQGLTIIPASTVLTTGSYPEISGVTTNWHNTDVVIDSLWSSALRAGLGTAIVGDARWKPLFGNIVTRGVYHERDDNLPNADINDAIVKDAIIEIKQGKSELILVSFLPEEPITHSLAEMRKESVAREEAIARIDTRLRRLLESIDLSSTAIFVASGHSPSTEGTLINFREDIPDIRLVAAGAGIMTPENPRDVIQWTPRRLVDIAPTCACLLGVSVPTHSQGEVIFSALDAPFHVFSERAIGQTATRARFATEYLRILRKRTDKDWSLFDAFLLHNSGDYENAYAAALDLDEEISLTLSKARSGLIASSRLVSIPVLMIIAVLIVYILTMILENNLRDAFITAVGMLGYFTTYFGLFLIRGIPLSSNIASYRTELARFCHGRILDSVISLVLMAIIIGSLVYRNRKDDRSGQGFVAGSVSSCFVIATLIVQVGVFVITEGFNYNLYLPDLQKAIRCLEYLIQLMVVGILSPILAGISQGVFLLASQTESADSEKNKPLYE